MNRIDYGSKQTLSWTLLIILSVIWGSSFILIKKGLEYFTPLQVGSLRITFAFLVMLPFALVRLNAIPKRNWKFLLFTGLLSNLAPAILFAIAQTRLQSSLTGILNALSPLFTLIFAVLFFKFKAGAFQIAGIIIGFVGIILLSLINTSGGLGSMNLYVWLIVLATICYALSLNFIKFFLNDMDSITITSVSLLIAGPVALTILFATGFAERINLSNEFLTAFAYTGLLGIVGTSIALIIYTKLIHMNTPVFASSVTYLVPVVAIMWGVLDNEILFPLHFAGMLFILFGIYLSSRTK